MSRETFEKLVGKIDSGLEASLQAEQIIFSQSLQKYISNPDWPYSASYEKIADEVNRYYLFYNLIMVGK